MKNFIAFLLIGVLFFNYLPITANAQEINTTDITESFVIYDSQTVSTISYNLSIIEEDLQKVYADNNIQYTGLQLDENLLNQGFDVEKITLNITTPSTRGTQYKIVTVDAQYKKYEDLSKKATGKTALIFLDTVFNLTIGTHTDKLWKYATLLQISPSNVVSLFGSGTQNGPVADITHHIIKTRKEIQLYYPTTGRYAVNAYAYMANIYQEGRYIGMKGKERVILENNDTSIIKTKHYDDESYLLQKAIESRDQDWIIVYGEEL